MELMNKPADKFEATRTVVDTIKDFDPADQEMIFRWAAESLGLPAPFAHPSGSQVPRRTAEVTPLPDSLNRVAPLIPTDSSQDIKSFVAAKNPRSDVQFVATVAYYYQFVAPPAEKKTTITKEILLEAFRKVRVRNIPPHPDMTLNNAYLAGLLDRSEKGVYAINSVGENLVTMTLPGEGSTPGKRNAPRKRSAKRSKVARKKSSSKRKA